MITVSTADNILKTYYLDSLKDQLDYSINPFYAAIEKNTKDVAGKYITKLVRYGVNGTVCASTEDGNLPEDNYDTYLNFTQELKNLFGTIRISDKAIKASATNEGAIVNALETEMEHLLNSAKMNFGRMLYGDGTGKIASFSNYSSLTFTVDTLKYIKEGMKVDVYSTDGDLLMEGKIVEKVDYANKQFSINNSASYGPVGSDGGFITMTHSYNNEIQGLGYLFSDGDYMYGTLKSRSNMLSPIMKTNVGTLTADYIQRVLDELEEKSGKGVNMIICSFDVRRVIVKLLSSNRMNTEFLELKGGYKAISFNGIPVVADRFCPDGTMYLLNTDDFCIHQLGDWDWLKGEDDKILKQIPGKPMFEATIAKYTNLMCYRPCGQAMISGITEE